MGFSVHLIVDMGFSVHLIVDMGFYVHLIVDMGFFFKKQKVFQVTDLITRSIPGPARLRTKKVRMYFSGPFSVES